MLEMGSCNLGRHCEQIGEMRSAERALDSASVEGVIRGGGIVILGELEEREQCVVTDIESKR